MRGLTFGQFKHKCICLGPRERKGIRNFTPGPRCARKYIPIQRHTTVVQLSLPWLILTQERHICTQLRTCAFICISNPPASYKATQKAVSRGHNWRPSRTVCVSSVSNGSTPNSGQLRWLSVRGCETFEIKSNNLQHPHALRGLIWQPLPLLIKTVCLVSHPKFGKVTNQKRLSACN